VSGGFTVHRTLLSLSICVALLLGGLLQRLLHEYPIDRQVRAILTTEDHPALVEMVNEAKRLGSKQAGGAFLINEFQQVLVPTQEGWYVAGTYERILTFDLDGDVVSPTPPSELEPGDLWPGPRVGMVYRLTDDTDDIYCKYLSGNREIKDLLSKHCGADSARFLAERLAEVKGDRGGRIYINEAREFFAPVGEEDSPQYLYLGPLDEESWFPPPSP
jgi:hypothetical protein